MRSPEFADANSQPRMCRFKGAASNVRTSIRSCPFYKLELAFWSTQLELQSRICSLKFEAMRNLEFAAFNTQLPISQPEIRSLEFKAMRSLDFAGSHSQPRIWSLKFKAANLQASICILKLAASNLHPWICSFEFAVLNSQARMQSCEFASSGVQFGIRSLKFAASKSHFWQLWIRILKFAASTSKAWICRLPCTATICSFKFLSFKVARTNLQKNQFKNANLQAQVCISKTAASNSQPWV